MDTKTKESTKGETSVAAEMSLLEEDQAFKKTEAAQGLIEGTHFVREEEEEFDPNTLLYAVKYMLNSAGTPMSNEDIVSRLRSEWDAHCLHQQLVMTDKRLGQLSNLHQYHDTFLKESQEALRLELFMLEERLVAAEGKKVIDKDGQEVDAAAQLGKLEGDMREIFKLIADYNEIFDNYKEAITELTSIFEASQATEAVFKARQRRQGAAPISSEMAQPSVVQEGQAALSDLGPMLVERNPEIDVQIEELLREMQLFHGKRVDLNARFDFVIAEIQKNAERPDYVPTKGDVLDEQLAVFINDAGLGELLRRQAHGQYVFGSKKIAAKILNSQLIIRVGGGYCHIEEFIQQYAKIEMVKMQTQRQLTMDLQLRGEGGAIAQDGGKPAAIMQLSGAGGGQQQAGAAGKGAPPEAARARSKSPRMKFGKSPREGGGFSPATVGKVISEHEFLKAMEKEMAAAKPTHPQAAKTGLKRPGSQGKNVGISQGRRPPGSPRGGKAGSGKW